MHNDCPGGGFCPLQVVSRDTCMMNALTMKVSSWMHKGGHLNLGCRDTFFEDTIITQNLEVRRG